VDFVLANGAWTVQAPPQQTLESVTGSYNSISGLTHDADTTAYEDYDTVGWVDRAGVYLGPRPPAFDYWFAGLGFPGGCPCTPTRHLGALPVTLKPQANWTGLFQSRADSTGVWTMSDSVPQGPWEYAWSLTMPSPAGDRVYFIVNRVVQTLDTLADWHGCASPGDAYCKWRYPYGFRNHTAAASVYSVPWAGGTIDSLFSLRDTAIVNAEVSEDGSELMIVRMSWDYVYYSPPRDPTSPPAGCAFSFVNSRTGVPTRTIPTLPCWFTTGGISAVIASLSSPFSQVRSGQLGIRSQVHFYAPSTVTRRAH